MCSVSWIAEDVNFVCTGIIKELKRIVGVVTIDNEEACMTISCLRRMFLEVGKPEYGQLAICPSFF